MRVGFEVAASFQRFGEVSVDDGEVGFADGLVFEKVVEAGGGGGVAGNEADAGGFAVETVDDKAKGRRQKAKRGSVFVGVCFCLLPFAFCLF